MKIEIVGDIITAKIGDNFVLLNEKFDYIMIDAIGRLIWEGLAQGNGLEDIAMAISSNYAVTVEEACTDAEIFIGELAKFGVVKIFT